MKLQKFLPNLKSVGMALGLFLILAVFPIAITYIYSQAAQNTGWRVNKNTSAIQLLNIHANCRGVTNISSTYDYFVPTNTQAEWNSAVNNAEANTGLRFQDCGSYTCPLESGSWGISGAMHSSFGKWVQNLVTPSTGTCLRPWTDYVRAPHYDDNERGGPPLTRYINICTWLGNIPNGTDFFITTDTIGGSWVSNTLEMPYGTAVFRKGIAANHMIWTGSGNKNHQSHRNYDGNCTVTIISKQGDGDRTNYHDRALAVTNMGGYSSPLALLNFGARPTGQIAYCQSGTCTGNDPNNNTWQLSGWTSCSVYCGGGVQTQIWECKTPGGVVTSPCYGAIPTPTTQACNTAACLPGNGAWASDPAMSEASPQCAGNVAPTGGCTGIGSRCNVVSNIKGYNYYDPYVCVNIPPQWVYYAPDVALGGNCSGNIAPSGACSPEGAYCYVAYSYKGYYGTETYQCGDGVYPINGSCNNGVVWGCSTGTANDGAIADTGTHYQWRCDGSNGGTNSGTCSYPKPVTGVCNNGAQNACAAGVANDGAIADTSTYWYWRCDGQYGGGNSGTCSYPKPVTGGTWVSNGTYSGLGGVCPGNVDPTGAACSPAGSYCYVWFDIKGSTSYSDFRCQ